MRRPRYSALILGLGILASCNPVEMSRGREASERAITIFHEQYNAERFEAIAADASDELPPAQRQQIGRILAGVHRKLGKVTATSNQGWSMSSFNASTKVQLVQATTFEEGTGVETFVWTISGERAHLTAYNISSEALILK